MVRVVKVVRVVDHHQVARVMYHKVKAMDHRDKVMDQQVKAMVHKVKIVAYKVKIMVHKDKIVGHQVKIMAHKVRMDPMAVMVYPRALALDQVPLVLCLHLEKLTVQVVMDHKTNKPVLTKILKMELVVNKEAITNQILKVLVQMDLDQMDQDRMDLD